MTPEISADAVNEALRRAYARKDMDAMRRMCSGVPDDVLTAIGKGKANLVRDDDAGWTVRYMDAKERSK